MMRGAGKTRLIAQTTACATCSARLCSSAVVAGRPQLSWPAAGAIVAGPLTRDKGILYAEIDAEAARRARRSLDVSGHYGRPDIFNLSIDRRPLDPVKFSD